MVVDALGNPVDFKLSPGQDHDAPHAPELLKNKRSEFVIADKAYGSQEIIELIEKQGATPVIPSRSNAIHPRAYDKHLYKERHLVECFFNRVKHFRRIATRYDKLDRNFIAFIQLAAALIWAL